MSNKPRILFFADYPNWAFHHIYRSISLRLRDYFEFDIYFSSLNKKREFKEKLDKEYDIIWITFPSDKKYLQLRKKPQIIIKEVASWRLKNNYKNIGEFFRNDLNDADIVATPSLELYHTLLKNDSKVAYIPNGVESWFFKSTLKKRKPINELVFGWVGNVNDPLKNFEIIRKLLSEGLQIKIAHSLNLFELRKFYSTIDVLLITSKSESQPLTLLEAISAGCFVISSDVGIVSEIIESNVVGVLNKDWSFQNLTKLCNNMYISENDRDYILRRNDWSAIIESVYLLLKNPQVINLKKFDKRHLIENPIKTPNNTLFKLRFLINIYWDLLKYGKRFN